jgi:uracil DNA glycosylase
VENSIKNIYEELNNTLNSFSFIDRYRLSKTAFIRKLALGQSLVVAHNGHNIHKQRTPLTL